MQLVVEDASAVRLGFTSCVTISVVLSTLRGTGHWTVEARLDAANPLLKTHQGVALAIRKRRYDETRARDLYARVLRAIEIADISRLRRTCLLRERVDEFFCWAFGLISMEDSLAGRRLRASPRRRR